MKEKLTIFIKRCRRDWYWFIGSVRYMFDPFIVIGCICGVMVVVSIVSVIVMCVLPENIDSIVLAIMTGVLASGVLAVFMEMANNYRRNSIRGIVLSELFSFLVYYESEIDDRCGNFDFKKFNVDFCKQLHIESCEKHEDDDINERIKTKAHAILSLLPEVMPLFRDAYTNHAGELKGKEVTALHSILTTYSQLISLIEGRLYIVICQMEDLDKDEIEHSFSTYTAKLVAEYIEKSRENNRHEQKLLENIAKEIIEGGEIVFNSLGIELTDNLNDDESSIESSDKDGKGIGYTVSLLLHDIDSSIRKLRTLAIRAPGHNLICTLYGEQCRKYRIQR